MKFTNTWTGNWENAITGMRHPLESYDKSDSQFGIGDNDVWLDEVADDVALSYIDNWDDERVDPDRERLKENLMMNGILSYGKYAGEYAFIGSNDLKLAQKLIKAGTPNDKFLRQIFVSVDITAPLYWWKEMDQYKVGTTTNSTSTMHKLASTEITKDCFEMDDYDGSLKMYDREPYNIDEYTDDVWESIICYCETLRKKYLKTKDIRYWKELIRLLPESWLQTRSWTANYSILRNIYHWRKNHKLKYEWNSFIQWCRTLPYAEELIFYNNGYDEEYKLHNLLS